MKILQIIHGLNAGGAERQLVELLKGMEKQEDIEFELVLLSEDIDYKYVNDLNVKLHLLKRKRKKDISVFLKLHNICKKFRPDIIHSWELMCSVYSIPIAKTFGAKFINGMIRYSPQNFSVFNGKRYIITKLSFYLSDYIVSNSHAGLRAYRVGKSKSVCIKNGFDFERIKNLKDVDHVKNIHNIKTDNIVGMVARFEKRKDYPLFITSAINILKNRGGITFITVGEGETLAQCMKLVPAEYQNNIRFLGRRDDVESIINIFDVGVLVSYEEGISNSIMEYMALGKPVIATRHGGNEEIVVDNQTGFLINPKDMKELISKILYLLDNKQTASTMGMNGRNILESQFSQETMASAYIKLYKECYST